MDSEDLQVGLLSDTITYTGNDIVLSYLFKEDRKTEGNETFKIDLYSSISNPHRGGETRISKLSSKQITILDTSLDPVYKITSDKSKYHEGDQITISCRTERVDQALPSIGGTGSGIKSSDLTGSPLSGRVLVGTDGTFKLHFGLTKDKLTEGLENLDFSLYSDSSFNNKLSSQIIDIVDSSQTPTYLIKSSSNTINEGDSYSFSIKTTDIDDYTSLHWKIISNEINSYDLDSPSSGSVYIKDSVSDLVSLRLKFDYQTEGVEKFRVALFSDASFSNSLSTSELVSVQDKSKTPTYSISSSSSSVEEE